jgi:hypothetical protein
LQALISKKPHAFRALRRAAWALLLPACLALSAPLSGCADLAAGNTEVPQAGPDPTYREVIGSHLKRTLKNYSTFDSFEVSDPRWTHSMKGWLYLTCVRFRDQGRVRSYSIFMDGTKIVDDHLSVQTDNCDSQAYYPLDRMQMGLDPLH